MFNPGHWCMRLEQKIFLAVIALELLRVIICPNPVDIIILIGMVAVFCGIFW